MKNKKLIVIFCIFVAVVLTVILGSTIFTLRSAELYFINEFGDFVQPDDSATGGVDLDEYLADLYGDNIVFLSKKEITKKIEGANHKIKVDHIEKVFPNKVRIYATVRVPLYSLKIDGETYVCSHDGFVMMHNPVEFTPVVSVEGALGSVNKPVVGEYVADKFKTPDKYAVIENFFNAVWRQEGFDYASIYNLIKSINLGEDKLTCETQRGATFVILRPDIDLFQKFTAVYGAYTYAVDKQESGVFTSSVKDSNGNYTVAVK